MKSRILSLTTLAALAIALTGSASAQVLSAPSGGQPYPPGYPQTNPPGYPQACPQRVTPSAQVLDNRYMRHFAPLNLMPQQQQRIQSIIGAFSQTHPAGSPLNVPAMHQLRDEVRSVLTSQQLALLEQINHERPPGRRRCP